MVKANDKTGEASTETRKMYVPTAAWLGAAGIAVAVFLIGLASGVFIGKSSAGGGPSARAGDSSQGLPGGMQGGPSGSMRGMGMFGGGLTGTVTEVSSSSITIKEQRTGGLVTYQITSDTEVTDDGDDAVIGDIKTGDTVMVQGTDSEDDTAAGTITLNPSTPTRGQFQ